MTNTNKSLVVALHSNDNVSDGVNVERYQKFISDLEDYLNHEIFEWGNIGKTDHDYNTAAALVDIRHEIERLKRLHLTTR